MPKDESGQVFDVSKPNRVGADPTGRPIIVGHQPMMSDPMMRDGARPLEHKTIPVEGASNTEPAAASPPPPPPPPVVAEHPESVAAAPVAAATGAEAAAAMTPPGDLHLASLNDVIGHENHQPGQHPHQPHHDHPAPAGGPVQPATKPRKKSKKGLWFLLLLILVFVAAYLAIDDRIIKTSINLPFHVFKQPTPSVSDVPLSTANQTPVATTAVPSGFTAYKLTGTTLSFDYPTAWGAPVISTDPGYSTRSATAASDGTYAYLVNFATNKDVQIALTSSKYLPTARTALYYDYLQWCVGTNDTKFYKSVLNFTTANKVDTPSTITCNQGPLTDATKLNSFTIVQLKTKNPDGTTLGDLYTVNLKEAALPVLRVKDATSANADNIKTLLGTIKSSGTTSSNTLNSACSSSGTTCQDTSQ